MTLEFRSGAITTAEDPEDGFTVRPRVRCPGTRCDVLGVFNRLLLLLFFFLFPVVITAVVVVVFVPYSTADLLFCPIRTINIIMTRIYVPSLSSRTYI